MQPHKLFWVGGSALLVTASLLPVAASAAAHHAAARPAAKAHPAVRGDFDGDGKPDLVAGAPGSARVYVSYTKAKISGSHAGYISSPDPNATDFGTSIAVGDFNGDGYADLAVGAPEYIDPGTHVQTGAVYLYRGSKTGLHYTKTVLYGPENGTDINMLGASMATGDVNGDGYADLAIGNTGTTGGTIGAGNVSIYFGSAHGLKKSGATGFTSVDPTMEGQLGASIAVADINGDGYADVIAGEPGGGVPKTGSSLIPGDIQIAYGGPGGLRHKHQSIFSLNVGANGDFGTSVAAGRINGDKYADVVAGAPAATVDHHQLAGKAVVLFGTKKGLDAKHPTDLDLITKSVPGEPKAGDRFGFSAAVNDLNGDGRGDVLIGIPGYSPAGQPSAGGFYVFPGSKGGLAVKASKRYSQASKGIPGAPVAGAEFGHAVGSTGTAKTANHQILIGIPSQHVGGEVAVLGTGRRFVATKHARLVKDVTTDDMLGTAFAS